MKSLFATQPLVGNPIKMETFHGDKSYAVVRFPGKRGTYFPYKTPEVSLRHAEEYLAEEMTRDIQRAESKAKHKAEKAKADAEAPALVNVGDIFYTSWGYDQTNIDFYQVVSKTGQMAVIRELCQTSERTYQDGGVCSAVKDSFKNDALPLKKRIQGSSYSNKPTEPYFKIASYAWAHKWDGHPKSYSDGH
jgi:hypothetical protein